MKTSFGEVREVGSIQLMSGLIQLMIGLIHNAKIVVKMFWIDPTLRVDQSTWVASNILTAYFKIKGASLQVKYEVSKHN